jgi:hypothetical protein
MSAPKLALVVVASFSVGCAGARTTIVAPTAEYPVSLSQGIRDAGGDLVPIGQREIVGHFEDHRTAWGLVYSLARLTPTKDLSSELNAQIKAAHGDAVVNLRIASSPCALNYVPVIDFLPIWPGCSNVTITGDIIRVTGGRPRPE